MDTELRLFIGVFDARGYSSAAEKGYVRRRRRKNVFLYIIIGPHLLNETEICLYIIYNNIYYIRDVYFSFFAVADLDGLYCASYI